MIIAAFLALTTAAANDVAAQQEPSAGRSSDAPAEVITPPPETTMPETAAEQAPHDTSAVPAPDAVAGDPLQALRAAQTRFLRLRDEGRNEEATAAALQVAELSQAAYVRA